MKLLLKEHCKKLVSKVDGIDKTEYWEESLFNDLSNVLIRPIRMERGEHIFPFSIYRQDDNTHVFQADYYVGIDWLIKGKKYVQVEPKMNKVVIQAFDSQMMYTEAEVVKIVEEEKKVKKSLEDTRQLIVNYREIDYLKMLLCVYSGIVEEQYLKDIVIIDWDTEKIPIEQKQDHLTPFLVVQFLQLLKKIVRKGLKKTYYKVQENLNGRVKGKILIGQQLKQNIFKNRLTSTVCEYQVFGSDSDENRFLKKVFRFVCSYVENNKEVFYSNQNIINNIINYCRSAFELIGDEVKIEQLKHLKVNAFFKEYKEAVKIGHYILNRFAYNISKTTDNKIETPPFWIDMPRLFELYVYHQLLEANPKNRNDIHFQFSTYGNALDILISNKEMAMVIDAKYKLHYKHSQVHEDIRQVSGYARLNKVLNLIEEKGGERESTLPCLIIYPTEKENLDLKFEVINEEKVAICAYHKVYKLGVNLPLIE